MRYTALAFGLLPLIVKGTNVVLSNDDGWAEINIRAFYNALTSGGDSVVISAPAENESGTGSSDAPATPLTMPCEYNSCPTGSPAEGNNASMPRFNYVNSYPVTSIRYGIQTLSPKYFGGAPDIAVAGFNVGANLGTTVLISGTVGAATEASKEGIPGIAFSGTTGSQTAWNTPVQTYQTVYADLSTNVTQSLVASGKPYLASNIWLNVNFPAVSGSTCSSPADFKFVLSRINTANQSTPADVNTCGSTRLPTETSVVDTAGCYASISVGVATTKGDATAAEQAVVLGKLKKILSCLP
ncbi:hypothetical protein OEA41_004474 [Lepraria neglecta]|uniref:Survival protein SurE-like phosphatase/nucleotidase domain-containing protein n=1 Tax=Lepraria neglecta TaxID=209136 RepID=A0AAE0DI99_9LECA|nr:hypothetical protein OEA41_004474 [Lepraria neglecta]